MDQAQATAPTPSRDDFAASVNTEFSFVWDELNFAATLVEFQSVIDTPQQECFSIQFDAPADLPARQGCYLVTHEKFGTFDLFVVPIGRKESGLRLEAVFNKLLA